MRPKFKVGNHVKIHRHNDNENYDSYRNKVLIITHVATREEDHPGYDAGLEGMGLYDLQTQDGLHVPFSLYDFELEPVRRKK